MYKKILLPTLLICLIATIGFGESLLKTFGGSGDPEPPKLPQATIGNWNHFMDPEGCVMLTNLNELKIQGVITLGTDNLSGVEDMYLYTQFYTDPPSISPNPINNEIFTPVELEGIGTVYRLTVEGYYDRFETECANDVDAPIAFNYTIKIVDANGNDYPFDLYPEILQIAGSGTSTDPPLSIINSSYEGVKDLCCHGYSGTPTGGEGFVENTNGSPEIENSNIFNDENNTDQDIDQIDLNPVLKSPQSEVFPNPFSASLNINLVSKTNEKIYIQIWDINGRLVHQKDFLPDFEGTHNTQINTRHLEPGFYFCSIKSDVQSQTFKILKTQ